MAIISTLDFENFAESATVTPAAPWSTNGATAVATNAAGAHGSRGARWASTATAGRLQYDSGADQAGPHVLSWYMYIRDYASVNHYIAGVRSLTTGGVGQGDVRINTNHTVSLRNAVPSAVATSVQTLAEDTLYRFEWRIHQAAGTQELRVYEGESAMPHLTIAGAWTGTNVRVFVVGPHVAADDGALDFDTVRLADDWTGPFAPAGDRLLSLVDFNALSDSHSINTAALANPDWDVYTTTTIPEAKTAAARHGARGALIPPADGPVIFNWNEANSTATRVMSYYFRLLVDGGASTYMMGLRHGETSQANWRINADRTVTLRNATIATGGPSPEALAMNTWYRAEWMTSTTGQELRIYEGESETPYITRTGVVTSNAHTRLSCGITASPSGHSLHIDTLRVGSDWLGPFGTPADPDPEPTVNTHFYVTQGRALRPFRLRRATAASGSETFPFWIGHCDTQPRAGAPPNSNPAFDSFEWAMKNQMDDPPTGPIGAFLRGYSGSNFPSTFQTSSVASAPSRGLGAMINVKRSDWQALANGAYDSTIQSFFNSWPVGTFGSFTINHEPENDGPAPATPSNSAYVAWASVQGPIWSQGIARTIAVAAPIIRARGLDVKLGGCLMDFSWDTTRWQYWDWWNYVDPQYFDVVEFQLDAYGKTVAGSPPRSHDLLPRLIESMSQARAAGIQHLSLFETASDRRERHNSSNIVGTDESIAAFWEDYFPALKAQIPETRMVAYFSIPTGPASQHAAIMGRGLEVFANACLNGRRP